MFVNITIDDMALMVCHLKLKKMASLYDFSSVPYADKCIAFFMIFMNRAVMWWSAGLL